MKNSKSTEKEFGYKLLKPFAGIYYRWFFNPKIEGKENIPKNGSFIICGNHKHTHDQFWVMLSTKRVIHYMAKKEYFEGKYAWFFRFVGQIPVDRSIHDESAKSRAFELLKNGGALGIFPEGTRNKTDALLLPFKFGAVSLAKKTNSLIVPFAITGDYVFRSKNLKVKIGKPLDVSNMELEEANKLLENTIKNLLYDLDPSLKEKYEKQV